ncbi:MAG: inverse autotransporter beta domain-containing protein [Pantoea sp.]|uniref:inverse autotransporter beta domain-containing protein n=1 Tax=Pantoea sp. TaxID=69393 RepID=UPI0039E72451
MKVQSTVLKAGESVADVAKRNKVSVDHLWEINSFAFSDKATFLAASAGQAIWIPAGKAAALPLERATQQDTKANKSAQQADVKVNDKTTDARHFGQNQLNSMAGQQAESWLNGFGGSSRVSISSDKNFSNYNYAGDVLVPLWDSRDFMIFSQLGARHADERTTGNIGFGSRYFVDGWMLGNNVFFDNDFSGNNRRIGLGAEIWTEALRLAANGYYGLNGWHQSKLLADHDERPANGWDIELASWLPMYPQLGGKVKYEQFYGDNVALMSRSNLQKNPSAVTMGVNWTPVPLVTVDAGHRKSMQSGGDTTVGLNLNWNFGQSLDWHLSPEAVADQRSLVGSRYELVSRNNEIVMDYREQTVITFSLASAIKGVEGTSQPLGVSVWAKHGLGKIVWDDAALVAAGGKITGTGANSALVLPAYKDGANNSYTLSAVAYDSKGKASPRAQVQITVEKAEQTIPEEPQQPEEPGTPEQPQQPDAGQTTVTLTSGELVADGSGKTEVVVELKDKDGKPVSNEAGSLRLEANMQSMLRSAEAGVTVSQFKEDGQTGRYVADVTAGTEPGVVTLTLYHGSNVLGQQSLTLTGKQDEVAVPTKVELSTVTVQHIAGKNSMFGAKVTDQNGKPMVGITVKFTEENGTAFSVTNVKTNELGVANGIMLNTGQVGTFKVTTHVGELTSNTQTVEYVADVSSAMITQKGSNPGTFKPGQGGSTTSAHYVMVLSDKYGNLLKNIEGITIGEANGYDQTQIDPSTRGKTNEKGELDGLVLMRKSFVPEETTPLVYNIYPLINGVRAGDRVVSITFNPVN